MTPRNETLVRKDERRKVALEGLNKLIELRAAFGSNDHEVISCLQGWLSREAQL